MSTSFDQVAHVRALIRQETATGGDQPARAGWLQRVCRAVARDLPAMGVGVSILSTGREPVPVAASSEASVRVEELQFVLGEGPCIDAYASRSPVLVPDISLAAATMWPAYAPAAHGHGVRAVFAFPLQAGAARLGALDVYRDHAGSMSPATLSRALTFADVVMHELLDPGEHDGRSPHLVDLVDDMDDHRFEVYQAQGMVMAQLDVSAQQALMRLRAYAFVHEQRAIDVARDILAGKLVLESDA